MSFKDIPKWGLPKLENVKDFGEAIIISKEAIKQAKFEILEQMLSDLNDVWLNDKITVEQKLLSYEDIIEHNNLFIIEIRQDIKRRKNNEISKN